MRRSLAALLARGIDSGTAERLVDAGYTLSKLKQLSKDELEAQGLSDHDYEALTAGRRPPIPEAITIQVLHAARWRCCVCRLERSVILHHIELWHESHNHSAENLAVLCLDHHGEAHTKRDLGLNLTAGRIRAMKAQWEEQVQRDDAAALVRQASATGATWDYINATRLYELAASTHVDLRRVEYYRAARAQGVVDEDGVLSAGGNGGATEHRYYFTQGPTPIVADLFLRALLHEVIARLDILDLLSHWRRSEIVALVGPGRFVWVQGLHRFRASNSKAGEGGREGVRHVSVKRRGIAVRFEIDPWWSMSNTSYSAHLRGHRSATSFCVVRDVRVIEGVLTIAVGCIAIGTSFDQPNRPPVPEIALRRLAEEEEEEGETDTDIADEDRF